MVSLCKLFIFILDLKVANETQGYEPLYDDAVTDVHPFFQTTVTALHMEDAEYSTKLPEDFYSSQTYASKVIEFLSERPKSEMGSRSSLTSLSLLRTGLCKRPSPT